MAFLLEQHEHFLIKNTYKGAHASTRCPSGWEMLWYLPTSLDTSCLGGWVLLHWAIALSVGGEGRPAVNGLGFESRLCH